MAINNAKYSLNMTSSTMELNQFADVSLEDLEKLHTGFVTPDENPVEPEYSTYPARPFPSEPSDRA